MAKTKRKKREREHDLVLIADRYLRGDTYYQIMDIVNSQRDYQLSYSQIAYDIKAIHNRWIKSSLVSFNEAKARELAKINKIEMEAWLAWERSKQDKEVSTTSRSTKGEGEDLDVLEKAEIRREGQAGNPRFLEIIDKCTDKRCKIFGLYAPTVISLDWRAKLEEQGIDPNRVFNKFVGLYITALESRDREATPGLLQGS